MAPALSRVARLGLLTGGLALLGGGALLVTPAGAQITPTLTVTPSTIAVGESADIVATGCVVEDTPQSDLFVVFDSSEGGPGDSGPIPTDEDGTATWNTGNAPEGSEGTYQIGATCLFDDGEVQDAVFEYDPASLTVAGAPETTTTTGAPTTTAPAAAAAATVTPAFTG
jgi:hypothetical protein